MKKYSIIVPIYNIEKYIEECIQSVIKQNYSNYELILIDDGSPDNSGAICDNYSKIYNNIKVIHKKNGGLSDARNAGIKEAQGKYILFLDGDDTLCDKCLECIDKQIGNSKIDLLSCDFNIYGNNNIKENNITKKICNLEDYIHIMNDIPWAAWRNVYNREIFLQKKILYEKGLVGAEDCELFIRFFEKCKNVIYSNINIVNYRINREGSITNKMNYKSIIGELNVFSKYFNSYYKKNRKIIYTLFAKKYFNTITTIDSIDNVNEMQLIINNINENKLILNYAKGFKYFIVKIFWLIFGYRIGTKIIRIFK